MERRPAARKVEESRMNPLGPEHLWRLSHVLYTRWRPLGLIVKKLNTIIYHNSLPPNAYGPGVWFGHHGFGTVIHTNVKLGRDVRIWHNVTISVHATIHSRHRIVIEDGVRIGANSVIIAPKGRSIRIGRGARIGAGALVVGDIPAGATVVGVPSQWRIPDRGERDRDELDADDPTDPDVDAASATEEGEGLGAVAEFIPPNGSAEQPNREIGA
jgi:serine O-acetyltransferase